MGGFLRISEAANIAIHSMAYIAVKGRNGFVSVSQIAEDIGVSSAHLSKVLQRLVKSGLLTSTRGAKGGFLLKRDPGSVSLLEILEAVEGPVPVTSCLLKNPVCKSGKCVLTNLLKDVDALVRDYLGNTQLSEFMEHLDVQGKKKTKRRK